MIRQQRPFGYVHPFEQRLAKLEEQFRDQHGNYVSGEEYQLLVQSSNNLCNKYEMLFKKYNSVQKQNYVYYGQLYEGLLNSLKEEMNTEDKHKVMIGEFMFKNMEPFWGEITGKLVGMMLEMEHHDLLKILSSIDTFHSEIKRAQQVRLDESKKETKDTSVKSSRPILDEKKTYSSTVKKSLAVKVQTPQKIEKKVEIKHPVEVRSPTPTVSEVLVKPSPKETLFCETKETLFCEKGSRCNIADCTHGYEKHYCSYLGCTNDRKRRCTDCKKNRSDNTAVFLRCVYTTTNKECWRHLKGNCTFVGHGKNLSRENDGSLTDTDKNTMMTYCENYKNYYSAEIEFGNL